MSEPRRNGGDLLVELLRLLDVDAAFGVVSVHNLPLVEALNRDLRWVATRGEAAAVNAADGYGRSRDGVGCAVTSTGTGAGNAAGSLIEALAAGAPLLHVTGQIDSAHLGFGRGFIHETRDQLGLLTACSSWATTIGDDPVADFNEARSRLRAPITGPVSLEWPIDRQYRAAAGDLASGEDLTSCPEPDDAGIEQALTLLAEAERPLVWAGGGAIRCGPELDSFLDRLGAGLITSNAGRGALAESDPRVVGNFASTTRGVELLDAADLLVSIGTHFRSNETRSYRLGLPTHHIQIDLDPAALGRSYPCEVGIAGEAGQVLRRLLDTPNWGRAERSEWRSEIGRARAACRNQLEADIGPYAPICYSMTDVLGPDGLRVRDITIPNSAWGNRLLQITDPRTNIYPRGGGIGQALAMGIGASVGRTEVATMVLIGDGGLQVQLGELAALAEEQLPVTLVVFDDGGYGVLRNAQDQYLGHRFGVDLYTPDFAQIATAFDLDYARVEAADQFHGAFSAAIDRGRPALIHVDCQRLGPMPKPFSPPVDLPEVTS
ncbi:MAG: acetolactate synthase [Actinobacteria bacterium]|nr:acetolactate synthase [Actinomycetota bacterium]